MHRSASWNRFSDDYFKHATSSSSQSPSGHRSSYSVFESNNNNNNSLPTYDPITELAKREKARVRFSENAVHFIPLVLLICAVILWIFSNPDVGIVGEHVGVGAGIEGLSLEGEFETDSDGTQSGFLPIVNPEEISTKELGAQKDSINLKKF